MPKFIILHNSLAAIYGTTYHMSIYFPSIPGFLVHERTLMLCNVNFSKNNSLLPSSLNRGPFLWTKKNPSYNLLSNVKVPIMRGIILQLSQAL